MSLEARDMLLLVKRAYLLYKFPKMEKDKFQRLTGTINIDEIPSEIEGWEDFYNQLK